MFSMEMDGEIGCIIAALPSSCPSVPNFPFATRRECRLYLTFTGHSQLHKPLSSAESRVPSTPRRLILSYLLSKKWRRSEYNSLGAPRPLL